MIAADSGCGTERTARRMDLEASLRPHRHTVDGAANGPVPGRVLRSGPRATFPYMAYPPGKLLNETRRLATPL
jgi:hypothetical protein